MNKALIERPPHSVEEEFILTAAGDTAEFDARVAGPGHCGARKACVHDALARITDRGPA